MIRTIHFLISAGVLFSSSLQAQTPASEYVPSGSLRSYFLGSWKLVSTENRYPDGRTTPYDELGENAVGFLIYTPDGHMCAQIMKPGRPRWADDTTPTSAEAASAIGGFVSYCGKFELLENERTIIHRPETAWSPNWVGTSQRRPFHLVSADRFFFRGERKEKQKDGKEVSIEWTITWERLK